MEKSIDVSLRNKAVVASILGAVMITGVAIGYRGIMYRLYEMTFLSNFLTATVLLTGAVKIMLTGRDIPQFLYLDCAVLLLTVVGICAFFAPAATFGGPGVILHLVYPVFVLAFYLSFCDGRQMKKSHAFTALVFPFLYYFFMIGFGRVTGGYIYVYFDPNTMSVLTLVLVGIFAAVVVSLTALILMRISGRMHVRRENKAAANDTAE